MRPLNPQSPARTQLGWKLVRWMLPAAAGWVLMISPKGEAHSVDEIRSLRDLNTSGNLLNFTVPGNSNYDANAILAMASVFYQTSERTALTYEYQLSFRLLDPNGNPVLISNQLQHAATSLVLSDFVTLPGPRGEDSLSRDYSLSFLPATQLVPDIPYVLELSLQKRLRSTDPFVATGDLTVSASKTYWHFPGLFTPDAAFNVLAAVDAANWIRTYAVKTVTGKKSFRANVNYTLQRFDDFLLPLKTDNITVHLNYQLRDAVTDAEVPLKISQTTFLAAMDSYVSTAIPNVNKPFVLTGTRIIDLEPTDPTQLDSVNQTFKLVVSIDHIDEPGQRAVAGNSIALAPQRLLHFNGHLFFGPIDTLFTSIDNVPPVLAVLPPNTVRTELGVDANSGSLVDKPNYTYGDGTDLPVALRSNGNADYAGLSPVKLNGPAPDLQLLGCIQLSRSNVSLDASGAKGDLGITLPVGFGYRTDLAGRLLESKVSFLQKALDASLLPVTDPVWTATIYASEETKPFWVEASALQWRVATSEIVLVPTGIQYVRRTELDTLAAAPGLVDPAMVFKRSNEQYFRFVNGVNSPRVVIKGGPDCAARMTIDVNFGPGQFVTHFPYDSTIAWAGSGTMSIVDDLVQPSSELTGVGLVGVKLMRDCFEPDCAKVGPATLTFAPSNAVLRFTTDGGLHAAGLLPLPLPLKWGWIDTVTRFTHETDPWSVGDLHVPGCFLRGDQLSIPLAPNSPPLALSDGPGFIHLTGVVPGPALALERPRTTAYQAHNVLGDYAGLNVVVGNASMQGESTLAALPTGPYGLRSRCKYYARFWGVSGVHEAVPGTFNAHPKLYGYNFTINNFSLSFLGSQNEQSRTEGSIDLPWPSEFVQDFKELKFKCNGALDDAKVPSDQVGDLKELKYWSADFSTMGIKFERCANGDCNPAEGFLVLGLEGFASNLEAPMFGEIGFRNNGKIITPAFASACGLPVYSRLQTDSNVQLLGPGRSYNLVPIIEAYYNDYDFIPSPGQTKTPLGFLNLAGLLDVTFFSDLRVHLHTGGRKDSQLEPPYLMGGWSQPGKGWEVNGKHFFNDPDFDAEHRSFDAAVSVVAQYRKQIADESDKHLVRAAKQWLGVVDLDYPLYWDPSLRYFRSQNWTSAKNQAIDRDLLVVHTGTEVLFLSDQLTDLSFGAQFSGVPVVDLASLAIEELAGDLFDGDLLLNLNAVKEALTVLNKLMNDDMRDFFAGPLNAVVPSTTADLYQELLAKYQPATKDFSKAPGLIIQEHCVVNATYQNSFEQRFNDILGAIGDPASTISEVYQALEKVTNGLAKVDKILEKTNGKRQSIAELVGKSAPDFIQDKLPAIDAAIQKAEPQLDAVAQQLQKLRTIIAVTRQSLEGVGEFAKELADVVDSFKNGPAFSQAAKNIETDINNLIGTLDYKSVDDPNQVLDEQVLTKKIGQIVENHFFSTGLPVAMQNVFKQRLYDRNVAIRQGVDSMFSVGSTIIRSLVAAAVVEAAEDFSPGLGNAATAMQTAGIHGYASINGDSLKYLRLDANVHLNLGAELGFDAFFEYSELDSTGNAIDAPCEPSGVSSWTEVTLGANNVQLGWISPSLLVNVETKFSFVDSPSFKAINLMGAFSVAGALKFETFEIKEVGFAVAMGEVENYLAAKLRVEFNKKEMAAGFFVGKTCHPEPLKIVNANFASALGDVAKDSPFTGMYGYGEAWYPINELLGIPSSCFFNVRGGAGVGVFVDFNGPVFGGQVHYGLSGEVLCLLEVQGEIDLVGIKNGDDYHFKGTGTVSGELGICPLCEDFSKTISMTMWVHLDPFGDSSVDTSVDF